MAHLHGRHDTYPHVECGPALTLHMCTMQRYVNETVAKQCGGKPECPDVQLSQKTYDQLTGVEVTSLCEKCFDLGQKTGCESTHFCPEETGYPWCGDRQVRARARVCVCALSTLGGVLNATVCPASTVLPAKQGHSRTCSFIWLPGYLCSCLCPCWCAYERMCVCVCVCAVCVCQ